MAIQLIGRESEQGILQEALTSLEAEFALGILEYDAVIELKPIPEARTAFSATREIRLTPGMEPSMLADMVQSETNCLREYFTD